MMVCRFSNQSAEFRKIFSWLKTFLDDFIEKGRSRYRARKLGRQSQLCLPRANQGKLYFKEKRCILAEWQPPQRINYDTRDQLGNRNNRLWFPLSPRLAIIYFIGEVAQAFKVNTSLIRFWENEFDRLSPKKYKKRDRFFTPKDIENFKWFFI